MPDLNSLVVVAAQTGDEHESTKWLCEEYMFPLMRLHNVRLIQVGRKAKSMRDRYQVISDSRQPHTLHIEGGGYTLGNEFAAAGVSQRLSRPHLCALKYKGKPIDWLIEDTILAAGEVFGPYIGYNFDEQKRSIKSDGYGCRGNSYRYPMIEAEESRGVAINFLYNLFGVEWRKSCCCFCPFMSKADAIARFEREPAAFLRMLLVQALTLAFNEKMESFAFGSGFDLFDLNPALKEYWPAFWNLWAGCEWAVYRVQRVYKYVPLKNNPDRLRKDAMRRITIESVGSMDECLKNLSRLAYRNESEVEFDEKQPRIARAWELREPDRILKQEGFQYAKSYWTACPHIPDEKVANLKRFSQRWFEITGQSDRAMPVQQSLF